MIYYTYVHYTKDTNEIFYVGKGKKNRHKQLENRNTWWKNKVNKHGGFTSKIMAYWSTETEALDHEKFLIDCLEEMGIVLVNIQKARGKEAGGRKFTPEQCAKYSLASKKKWAAADPEKNKAWGQAISLANKNKPKTEKHKQNLSKARQGIKVPSIWKPIKCVTTGIVYPSLTEAAKATNCDASHIVKCCRGKLKTTKNLEFMYG